MIALSGKERVPAVHGRRQLLDTQVSPTLIGNCEQSHWWTFSIFFIDFPSQSQPNTTLSYWTTISLHTKLVPPFSYFSPSSYFPSSSSPSPGTLWTTCPTWSTAWTTASTSRWAEPWWCAPTRSNRLLTRSKCHQCLIVYVFQTRK